MKFVSSKLIDFPSDFFFYVKESFDHFRGRLPTADQILESSDLIELKKCMYASQVS
jgi:hypothetical protein